MASRHAGVLPPPIAPLHLLFLLKVLTSLLPMAMELCRDFIGLGTRGPVLSRSGLQSGAQFLLAKLVWPLCPGARPLLHRSVVAAVEVPFLSACPTLVFEVNEKWIP